ncbi:MAG: hypothetical protein ACJA0G_001642 [Kangiellaceae bacterium]
MRHKRKLLPTKNNTGSCFKYAIYQLVIVHGLQ